MQVLESMAPKVEPVEQLLLGYQYCCILPNFVTSFALMQVLELMAPKVKLVEQQLQDYLLHYILPMVLVLTLMIMIPNSQV